MLQCIVCVLHAFPFHLAHNKWGRFCPGLWFDMAQLSCPWIPFYCASGEGGLFLPTGYNLRSGVPVFKKDRGENPPWAVEVVLLNTLGTGLLCEINGSTRNLLTCFLCPVRIQDKLRNRLKYLTRNFLLLFFGCHMLVTWDYSLSSFHYCSWIFAGLYLLFLLLLFISSEKEKFCGLAPLLSLPENSSQLMK